jgi:hypothetical protein
MAGRMQRAYVAHQQEASQIERLFNEGDYRMIITYEEKLLVPTDLIDGASRIFKCCGNLLYAAEDGNYEKRRLFGVLAMCLIYYKEIVEPGSDPRFLFNAAIEEAAKARAKFPLWPVDYHQAAVIVAEEGGELLKAANEVFWSHKDTTKDEVYKELVQTVAMCIRFYIETIWINE